MEVKTPDQWLEIWVPSWYPIAEKLEWKLVKLSIIVGGVQIRVKVIFNIILSSVPYSKDIKDDSTSEKYAPENL
jgi:hypothetical protein